MTFYHQKSIKDPIICSVVGTLVSIVPLGSKSVPTFLSVEIQHMYILIGHFILSLVRCRCDSCSLSVVSKTMLVVLKGE